MRELHLFAGAGGGILGGMLLGHTPVCAVEIEPYCRRVLLQRQRDGVLPWFPIWDDVRTFRGEEWRGQVDVVCGGFPCQDISSAGKGAGITGARSGLWSEFARIIGEVGPRYVFVENSPNLTSRGLGTVLGNLATLGFDAEWGVLGADDAGAPHRRKRIWILGVDRDSNRDHDRAFGTVCGWASADSCGSCNGVANASGGRCSEQGKRENQQQGRGETKRPGFELADTSGEGLQIAGKIAYGTNGREAGRMPATNCWWESEPGLGRVAHGVANRVDRLKAIGNGQVPQVAAMAWHILMERLQHGR